MSEKKCVIRGRLTNDGNYVYVKLVTKIEYVNDMAEATFFTGDEANELRKDIPLYQDTVINTKDGTIV